VTVSFSSRDDFPGNSKCLYEINIRNQTKYLKIIENVLCIKTPWPESASELYLPRDLRFSVKLVPAFAVRCCVVIAGILTVVFYGF
jgi:hypothetical protein